MGSQTMHIEPSWIVKHFGATCKISHLQAYHHQDVGVAAGVVVEEHQLLSGQLGALEALVEPGVVV